MIPSATTLERTPLPASFIVLFALLSLFGFSAHAQCPGVFRPGAGIPGVNDRVLAITPLPSGDIVAGGQFSAAGHEIANHIARYTAVDNTWRPLGPGTDGVVTALASTPDGSVVAGGTFQHAGALTASNIARFDSASQSWSALGAGVSGSVGALLRLPSGDLIAGGAFTSAGGVPVSNISRFSASTQSWSAMGAGVNAAVNALALLPSGDVVVGGLFTTADTQASSRLALWNPTSGVWTPLARGPNGPVYALGARPSGQVVVGGAFSQANQASASNIVMYTPTTNTWTPLGQGISGTGGHTVYALDASDPDLLVVGGDFDVAGSVNVLWLARYQFSLGTWQGPGFGANSGRYTANSGGVRAIARVSNGLYSVGGTYYTAGSTPISQAGLYNASTQTWAAMSAGTNLDVTDLAPLADGRLVATGYFSSMGGASVPGIAISDAAREHWQPLGPANTFYGTATAACALPDGDVIVAGNFTLLDFPFTQMYLMRFRSAQNQWSAVDVGPFFGTAIVIKMLYLPAEGTLLIGGLLNFIRGSYYSGIVRYNPATDQFSDVAGGVAGSVSDLLQLPDGDVMVAGGISFIGSSGQRSNGIARLRPSTNQWTPYGNRLGGDARALTLTASGDVIVGGHFPDILNGPRVSNIVRFSPSDQTWSPMGAGVDATVSALATLDSGDILVGGEFQNAGGAPASRIARFRVADNTWVPVGAGLNGTPLRFTPPRYHRVTMGGSFTVADGAVSAFTVQLVDCPADVTCDGVVNSQDFFAFLECFFAPTPCAPPATADFNHDGAVTSQDFFDFLQQFFTGCD